MLTVKLTIQLLFTIGFQKVDQHTGGKWLVPCKNKQTPQGQSVAKPGIPLYPIWDYKFYIKESDGYMFNPIS